MSYATSSGENRVPQHQPTHHPSAPLCVDLDGTLVRSDILVESFFGALKKNIWVFWLVPIWLLRGKAYLKHRLAQLAEIDCRLLPYNKVFVDFLRVERTRGRRLVLATATHEHYAHQIAEHLDLFDEVIASNSQCNLSGSEKRDALVARFGTGGFDYAGNGKADLKVLSTARRGILVDPERGVKKSACTIIDLEKTFISRRRPIRTWARAMRVHQWLKNVLIFVPLLVAHKYMDLRMLALSVGAFIAFGLCASATYLLNDLFDLSSDRVHPRKRLRPLPAGDISVKTGAVLVSVLLGVAFALAFWLSFDFALILLGYVAITLNYSLWLKRKILVDVLVLAGLYTVRIFAGSAVTGIVPSVWLLAFSIFLFLSLALVKRYTELLALKEANRMQVAGRGYEVTDISVLQSLGIASGYLSVLVLALYINSSDVHLLYKTPEAIWLLCPLLLYWVSRLWLRAGRSEMHDDPLVYALKDRISRWIVLSGCVLLMIASLDL
ncbi:MAG: UbiA family prenyltransferase [Gammaproteobacteria bacterium]|nr:UbiA family prenyltransferase [Gammaproteobacteria bacterium]